MGESEDGTEGGRKEGRKRGVESELGSEGEGDMRERGVLRGRVVSIGRICVGYLLERR